MLSDSFIRCSTARGCSQPLPTPSSTLPSLSQSCCEPAYTMAMELSFFGPCSAVVAGQALPVGSRPALPAHLPFAVVLPGRKPVLPLCAASKTASAAKQAKRPPRGITKARPVSPAMQELLGVAEIPRTQAVKQIWNYIKQHDLQVSYSLLRRSC